jgi:hypothetical protein
MVSERSKAAVSRLRHQLVEGPMLPRRIAMALGIFVLWNLMPAVICRRRMLWKILLQPARVGWHQSERHSRVTRREVCREEAKEDVCN